MTERVVLAYSGGLDTSVAIGWIAEKTGAEVIAVAADVGQGGEDLEEVRKRALACGAVEAEVLDLREEFADHYCLPALRAGALYMERYPLRLGAVPAGDRRGAGRRRPAVRRGHRRARLHRQGQRPGPVRGRHRRARARPAGARAGPGLRHDQGRGDRLRRAQRPADRRDRPLAVLDRPEPLGPRGRDRLPRGPVERADRGALLVHVRPAEQRGSRTRCWSGSTPACRPRSTAGR